MDMREEGGHHPLGGINVFHGINVILSVELH
jgi:hypothetical protein